MNEGFFTYQGRMALSGGGRSIREVACWICWSKPSDHASNPQKPNYQGFRASASSDRFVPFIRRLEVHDRLQGVAEALPAGPRVVLVQDREADVFAFLAAPRPPHIELIVRVCQPRRVEVEASREGKPRTVLEAARQAPVLGQVRVQVPRKPGQPEREAVVELAATAVVVKAPRRRSADVPAASQALLILSHKRRGL